jgi:hypothetical protein
MRGLFPVVRDAVATLILPSPACAGSASAISRPTNAAPSRNGRPNPRGHRGVQPGGQAGERG